MRNVLSLLVLFLSYCNTKAEPLPSEGVVLHCGAQAIDGDSDFMAQPIIVSMIRNWHSIGTCEKSVAFAQGNEDLVATNTVEIRQSSWNDGTNHITAFQVFRRPASFKTESIDSSKTGKTTSGVRFLKQNLTRLHGTKTQSTSGAAKLTINFQNNFSNSFDQIDGAEKIISTC
jgi:hypothetical protein